MAGPSSQVSRMENVLMYKKMLKHLDDTLHCPICKELFTYSVITKCSHSFCSVCIRRSLTTGPYCPVCIKDAQESDLRRNTLLDQIVRIYRKLGISPDVLSAIDVMNTSFDSIESDTPRNSSPSPREQDEERTSNDESHNNISNGNDFSNETSHDDEMDTGHPPGSSHFIDAETVIPRTVPTVLPDNLQRSLANISDLGISSDRASTAANFQFKHPNPIPNRDGMDASTSSNRISQPGTSRGSSFSSNNYQTSSNSEVRNHVPSTGDSIGSEQAVVSEVAQNANAATRLSSNTEWHESFVIPWNQLSPDLIQNLRQGIRLIALPRRIVVKMIYNEVKRFDPRPDREILKSIAKRAVETYPNSLCDYDNESPSVNSSNALFSQLSNRFRCPLLFEDEHLWST